MAALAQEFPAGVRMIAPSRSAFFPALGFAVWFKVPDSTPVAQQWIVGRCNEPINRRVFRLGILPSGDANEGKPYFETSTAGTSWTGNVVGLNQIVSNKWTFITCTHNGNVGLTLFQGDEDGGAIAQNSGVASQSGITNQTTSLQLSGTNAGSEGTLDLGAVDTFLLYPIALSLENVTYLYNTGTGINLNFLSGDTNPANPGAGFLQNYHKLEEIAAPFLDEINNDDLNAAGTPTRITGYIDESLTPAPGAGIYTPFRSGLIR